MPSLVTSKKVSWHCLIWPTMYAHGRPQAWARDGTCSPLENVQAIFTSITFWRAQKNRNRSTRHVSPAQNIPKLWLRSGLMPWTPLPLGSLQRSPDILASQQRRKGRVNIAGRKREKKNEETGKGWREKGGGRIYPFWRPCKYVYAVCLRYIHWVIALLWLVFHWDQRLRLKGLSFGLSPMLSLTNHRHASSLTSSAIHRWFRRIFSSFLRMSYNTIVRRPSVRLSVCLSGRSKSLFFF